MPYDATLIDSRNNEIGLVEPYVRLREIEGLGMPEVRHIEETYAYQDGVSYLESRLAKRIIQMRFDLWATTESGMWTARDQMLRLLRVFAAGFSLRLTLPNGAVRQIDLRYDSQFTLPRVWDENNRIQPVVLQCVAHNPTFYDPTPVLWAFAVSGGGSSYGYESGYPGTWGWEPGGLGFPAGWGLSTILSAPEAKIYTGSWRTYPLIALHGPMTEPVIENRTTGDKIEFVSGYKIDLGERIDIDLRTDSRARRALTVTHSVDGNVPDALTDDSTLSTFHIAAHPDAVDGINEISVRFTGGSEASRAEIRFHTRYIGV